MIHDFKLQSQRRRDPVQTQPHPRTALELKSYIISQVLFLDNHSELIQLSTCVVETSHHKHSTSEILLERNPVANGQTTHVSRIEERDFLSAPGRGAGFWGI